MRNLLAILQCAVLMHLVGCDIEQRMLIENVQDGMLCGSGIVNKVPDGSQQLIYGSIKWISKSPNCLEGTVSPTGTRFNYHGRLSCSYEFKFTIPKSTMVPFYARQCDQSTIGGCYLLKVDGILRADQIMTASLPNIKLEVTAADQGQGVQKLLDTTYNVGNGSYLPPALKLVAGKIYIPGAEYTVDLTINANTIQANHDVTISSIQITSIQ